MGIMVAAQPMQSLVICLIGFLTARCSFYVGFVFFATMMVCSAFQVPRHKNHQNFLRASPSPGIRMLIYLVIIYRASAMMQSSHKNWHFVNSPTNLPIRSLVPISMPILWTTNAHSLYGNTRREGFPGCRVLKKWIASRPHPITLLLNNIVDRSWPLQMDCLWLLNWKRNNWKQMLSEPHLHAAFVRGLWDFENKFTSKVKPMPPGLKWQHYTTKLFGEPKGPFKAV